MANRFLNNIKINDSYTLPPADGTADQIIKTDGLGELSFVDQGNIVAGEAEIAKTLQVTVKNVSGGELTKGTVVHVSPSANPPSGNIVEVIAADYDDATKMPAVGILKETIADEAEGEAVMSGALSGIATDGFTAGDELYVGADGALTNAKPQTAGQLIQKIAVCVKSHASNGLIKIFGAGRSNDVPLPLYIDNTNQRVGIGVPSPDAKLDVAGRAVIGTSNTLTNATNATVIGNSNNLTSDSIVDSNTNLVLGDYGAGRYANTVISDRTLRLGRADVITATVLNTTGILNFNDSVEANSAFSNVGGIVGYFPPPTTTNDYYFISAFSENVGSSAFTAGASPTASRYQISTSPSLNCILQKFDGNTTNSGAAYIIASNNSSTPSSRGIFTFDARHQNQNSTVPNGHALFEVTSGYGQTKFIIKQVNGSSNVGIGTTSPSAKLHVIGDSNSSRAAIFESTSIYGTGVILKNGSNGYGRLAQDGNNLVIHNSTEDGHPIIFSTTPGVGEGAVEVERMRIDGDNGKVGIGTDSPGKLLELKGGDNEAVLRLFNDQANTWDIQNSTLGKLDFIRGSSNTYMRIDQNGSVGIGTTFPLSKLDVSGDTSGTLLTLKSLSGGTNDAAMRFYDESNGPAYVMGLDSSDEKFKIAFDYDHNSVSSGTKLTIDTSGNVGIGTTSPSQKLHVNGSALVTSNLYIYNTSFYIGLFFGRFDMQATAGLNVRSGTTYKPVYASAFTVSSDYRLKSNIVPLENAISRVNQLEVHRFNWNDRLNEPKVDGFIAHEVAAVIPEAVLGEKDAMHEDGTPNHQGIDQAKIVPLLTAALQEAIAKIESLESRIQTLENQ